MLSGTIAKYFDPQSRKHEDVMCRKRKRNTDDTRCSLCIAGPRMVLVLRCDDLTEDIRIDEPVFSAHHYDTYYLLLPIALEASFLLYIRMTHIWFLANNILDQKLCLILSGLRESSERCTGDCGFKSTDRRRGHEHRTRKVIHSLLILTCALKSIEGITTSLVKNLPSFLAPSEKT